jgi:hypothetical protein
MDNEMIPNPKGIFIQLSIARHQSQRSIGAGLGTQGFFLVSAAIQAKVTIMG